MGSREAGVTLLELSIVLTAALFITLAAIDRYRSYEQSAKIEALGRQVDTLLAATRAYYQAHCSDTVMNPFTVNTLLSEGFLARTPQHPFGSSYHVSIERTPTPRVAVSTPLPLVRPAGKVNLVGADAYAGGRFVWYGLLVSTIHAGAELEAFRSMYEAPCS